MEKKIIALRNPMWLSEVFICSKIKDYNKYCFVKVNCLNKIEEIGKDAEKRLHATNLEDLKKYYIPVTKTYKMRFNSIDHEYWWHLINKQ